MREYKDMSYRFKLFPEPIKTDYKMNWETLIIEASIGIICAIMATTGWQSGMILVVISCGFVAMICGALIIYSQVVLFLSNNKKRKT